MGAVIGTWQAAAAGVMLALFVAAGGWLWFAGLGARRDAGTTFARNRRLEAMLETAPAQALIVRSDGRIDMSERLATWLGLSPRPAHLSELSGQNGGLTLDDQAALSNHVSAAQKSGKPFAMAIRPQGSARALLFQGQRAGDAANKGGVIVWAFDATEAQAEIERLEQQGSEIEAAFQALRGLIEAAPMPMWYRGPDLRLAMVNSAYVAAVEAGDSADVVRRGVELFEGSGGASPIASAAAARDSGAPQEQTMPATIAGARRMLHVHDIPLPTGGVAGFAVDVEEQEQAHAGLKRFAEAQRAMLDRLSAGVAQFSADRSLVFCNQPFMRLFAMRPEWISDRPEFDRVLERMREAKRLPEVRDFPGWKAERREWFTTSSGAEEQWHLPGGVHLRVVAQPLPDGALLLIFEDRTEEVQLASARDTLLRVRTATFDNLFEALGVFAADGKLQLWNNRFRQVWSFEEEFLATHPRVDALAAQAAHRLSNPERASLIADLVRSATVDRQQRGGRVQFADGRTFEFAAVPLPDGNALFTMLDITDSRKIEAALTERNEALEVGDRMKTSFMASMSYELRTPLTSIGGFAEMLHGGYAGKLPPTADEYVEAILESAARLGTLIDDVLDLTQNEGGVERGEVDLEAIAHAAAETIAPLARKKELDFAIELSPSAGSVTGDAGRLRQVIEHLLRHAVLGTPAGGRVLLHVDGTVKHARIIVSDDGPGMTQEAAEHVFDRFAQTNIARDDDRPLGLGLPLAKQFVEAHGGTIALVSEPGEGTLVTVELPRG